MCLQAACTTATDPYVRYGYDGVGNRTSVKRGTAAGEQSETWTYNAADELTSDGSATYTYDDNGNETADGHGHTYTYDSAGNRISTTTGSGTTTYAYSGTGLLLARNASAGQTTYSWDENNALAQLASQTTGAGTTESFYGLGRISSHLPDGSDAYYHYDPQNSVTAVTDGQGQTQHSSDYDPFGVLRSHTDATGAQLNGFGFAGELSDPTSGLSYMRARWYEPGTGRFTATDPLAPGLSEPYPSAYQYANGQPTVLGDPSGMVKISIPSPSDVGMWVSTQSAKALDGLTAGYSTKLAGTLLGFNSECTPFGSGVAHWAGFAGSFFIGAGEGELAARGAAEGGEGLLARIGQRVDLASERGSIGRPTPLTNSQATDLARWKGFEPTGERLRGQTIFRQGNRYIVQDIDSHMGGTWKMADSPAGLRSKGTRMGTYDEQLNRIGP